MISASCEWPVQRTRVRNGYALWRCDEAGPAPWSTPGPRLFKLWSERAIRGGSGRGAEGLPGLSARDAGDERRHSSSRMGLARHTARNSTAPERRTERRTSEREVHDADSNPRSAPHRLQCARRSGDEIRRPGHRYDEISSVKLVAGHLRIDDQLEGVELVAGAQPFERAVPLGGERR